MEQSDIPKGFLKKVGKKSFSLSVQKEKRNGPMTDIRRASSTTSIFTMSLDIFLFLTVYTSIYRIDINIYTSFASQYIFSSLAYYEGSEWREKRGKKRKEEKRGNNKPKSHLLF